MISQQTFVIHNINLITIWKIEQLEQKKTKKASKRYRDEIKKVDDMPKLKIKKQKGKKFLEFVS